MTLNLTENQAITEILARGPRMTEVRGKNGLLVFTANVGQLLALGAAKAVEFVVDPKKQVLRYARLLVGVRSARQIAGTSAGGHIPIAEANFTISRVAASDGRKYFEHNDEICASYLR